MDASPDGQGWIDEPAGSTSGWHHHMMAIATIALIWYGHKHSWHTQAWRLGSLWWNGCNIAGAVPAGLVPGERHPAAGDHRGGGGPAAHQRPTDMLVKVKQVQNVLEADVAARQDDTVDDLVGRIEVQVGVAVANLLYAGEILTRHPDITLRAAGIPPRGAVLIFTPRPGGTPRDPPATRTVTPAAAAAAASSWLSGGGGWAAAGGGAAAAPRATAEVLAARAAQPRATRCQMCNEKLPPMATALACRCKQVFCDRHRAPAAHSCDYDPKLAARDRLLGTGLRAEPAPPEQLFSAASAASAGQYARLHEAHHPGEATVLSFKGSYHCLSLCFSAFRYGSTALTSDRCNQRRCGAPAAAPMCLGSRCWPGTAGVPPGSGRSGRC
eukprot:SAG22_NODE_1598_length_4032_cov_1.979405_1_plen_383_part_00